VSFSSCYFSFAVVVFSRQLLLCLSSLLSVCPTCCPLPLSLTLLLSIMLSSQSHLTKCTFSQSISVLWGWDGALAVVSDPPNPLWLMEYMRAEAECPPPPSTHYLIKMDQRLQVISLIMPQWQGLYHTYTHTHILQGLRFKYFYIHTAFIQLALHFIFTDIDNVHTTTQTSV